MRHDAGAPQPQPEAGTTVVRRRGDSRATDPEHLWRRQPGGALHQGDEGRLPAALSDPRAVGLLTDIECSRVRDSSWMYLTSFVTTRIDVELAAIQRKLPDCVVVGLQLYSARTFHVTLSPRIYKGGQGPPPKKTSTPKVIQTTQDVGYYANSQPEPV